jgi:hypothetical protein
MVLRRRTVPPDAPADSIVARVNRQALQQARAGQSTRNIPHSADHFFEPLCVATINSGHPRNSFAKDLAGAFAVPATIAMNDQPDPHSEPLPGEVSQPARIAAVDTPLQRGHVAGWRVVTRISKPWSCRSILSRTSVFGLGSTACEWPGLGAITQTG